VLAVASIELFEDVDLFGREACGQLRRGFRDWLDPKAILRGRCLREE
jgi:hypothetical protein